MSESFSARNGAILRAERERLGHSQESFAELLGVSRGMLSRYERGVAEPGASVLMHLMATGADVAAVLGGRPAAPAEHASARTLTAEQEALLDNYENADEEGRAAARRVLSSLAQSNAARKAA
ncbi:helix-turn-helix protein [Pseudacidovorax intermedius]|uniref:Helix-turn-helix protein n=1 Tax=Pseudacidovorax intermedius TaxID=433924 RepID=A0A370FB36_9BURK|nr:helix-turn-helix transcriptional regulator [Pseudacidovorax intermedius]RDI20711.1 helix-turn-helix protein [Pseudacidovorax intermedius]